jgi:hypothetical protein
MKKSALPVHMQRIKASSKLWMEKCEPGPIKGKVTASQTKQTALAFVHNKGMVYTTNYMPRGAT